MKRKLIGIALYAGLVCSSFFCGTPYAAAGLNLNDEQVVLMVTLNSPSLIDYVNEYDSPFRNISELSASPIGKEYISEIESSHKLAIEEIM